MKLYTAQEMSAADSQAQALGIPAGALMERAGAAITAGILASFTPQRALVVSGGGNNGGDGFVIARELRRAGAEVAVLATKDEYKGDPATNLEVLRNLNVRFIAPDELGAELEASDLVVDALLGTGFSGEVREKEAALIRRINDSAAPVVSVDMPSGVDGSTGEVQGEAIEADLTVCAHAAKVGCVVSPGMEYAGEVAVVEIGVPPEADVEPSVSWVDAGSLLGEVPRTAEPAHKYSAGAVLVVAGSRTMTGAAVMSVQGAQRAGCGIVFLATAESTAPALDLQITEAIVSGAPEDDAGHLSEAVLESILQQAERASALVVGPALGTDEGTRRLVEGILSGTDTPVLLDADAVTSLAGSEAIKSRNAPTVITPHAGELGRLMGESAGDVSAGRLGFAREAAREHGCCVLLKGSDTIVTEGGRTAVNSTGTVALATGGTGDVLAGVIGALLSRGMSAFDAARTGAWVHGRAAQLWLEETGWPEESLIATDLPLYLPLAFDEIL